MSVAPLRVPPEWVDSGRFDGWVFDVTGTLLLPDPPVADLYHRIAAPLGCQLSREAIAARFGPAIRRHFGDVSAAAPADPLTRPTTDEAGERRRWRKILSETLDDLPPRAIDQAFDQLWSEFARPEQWRLRPGAAETISRLNDAGCRLAIASNFDSRVHRVLDGHPPLDRVSERFISSEVGFIKPDRRFFEAIAQRMGVAPQRLVMIGDDPVNDLAGAQAAGWHALHLPT
jgi:putative hydrolase of the HAD superfamily